MWGGGGGGGGALKERYIGCLAPVWQAVSFVTSSATYHWERNIQSINAETFPVIYVPDSLNLTVECLQKCTISNSFATYLWKFCNIFLNVLHKLGGFRTTFTGKSRMSDRRRQEPIISSFFPPCQKYTRHWPKQKMHKIKKLKLSRLATNVKKLNPSTLVRKI